jgi:hypothetical protein
LAIPLWITLARRDLLRLLDRATMANGMTKAG